MRLRSFLVACGLARASSGAASAAVQLRLYDGPIKSAQIVEFLKGLRGHLKRRLLIVWDGAAQHKSRIVRAYLESTNGAMQMALLPVYSPELNPVEYLSGTYGLGANAAHWPTSVCARWPSSKPPLATDCAAPGIANRSSSRAGSRPGRGDVMSYVKLNRAAA